MDFGTITARLQLRRNTPRFYNSILEFRDDMRQVAPPISQCVFKVYILKPKFTTLNPAKTVVQCVALMRRGSAA